MHVLCVHLVGLLVVDELVDWAPYLWQFRLVSAFIPDLEALS